MAENKKVFEMDSKENSSKEVLVPKSRLIIGSIVFISGFISPILIPFISKLGISTGAKTTISGLLLVGIPEIFMLITVAILGKEGYNYLKRKVKTLIRKHGPPEVVSQLRYRIGLVMFSIPLLIAFISPYLEHHFQNLEFNGLYLNIGGDILLISSLFVLGGEFWDKIRSLFIYKSIAVHKKEYL